MSAVALTQLRYAHRLYGGLRRANRDYSPDDDMARYPFPRAIQLQTINACQASCVMCPYPVFKDAFQRGRMDEALFDKITDEIAGRTDVDTFIPMLQNEPFLDKRLLERVRRFKDRTGGRVKVELVTNGAFLSDDTVAQIRESRLDVLDISLDALSREVYGKIRIGLDYDAVREGVDRVLRADLGGTKVFVRLIRLRENKDEVRAFARYWRARGGPVFIYTANNRTGALDEIGARDALISRAETPWYHRAGRRLFRAYIKHCPLPFASTNILHNGDMLMCVHDWGRKEVIGNVRESTIAELWTGPRMREIRRLVSQRRYDELPACKSCTLCHDGWL